MCFPRMKFQRVNPTTQVALFALCPGLCSSLSTISWKIYRGSINSSLNSFTEWILLHPNNSRWFFGRSFSFPSLELERSILSLQGTNTSRFTATSDLFSSDLAVRRWRFEVVYSFSSRITSSSSLNFEINSPPSNGSCSIQPRSGTTTTLFNVSCPHRSDDDQIKDYSLLSLFLIYADVQIFSLSPSLAWSVEPSERRLIGFSLESTFEVYLPAGRADGSSSLRLLIEIRDEEDCVTEWTNLSSIVVRVDVQVFDELVKTFKGEWTSNPWIQLLKIGNQNEVAQMINSLSEQINQLDQRNLDKAIEGPFNLSLSSLLFFFFSGGIPASMISIS